MSSENSKNIEFKPHLEQLLNYAIGQTPQALWYSFLFLPVTKAILLWIETGKLNNCNKNQPGSRRFKIFSLKHYNELMTHWFI